MKITIHRGSNQIGGCVTEYEQDGWKLFVDYGEQLPGSPVSDTPLRVEGLTHGDVSKSALLITHYHGDHLGKIHTLPDELPIYVGKTAAMLHRTYSDHTGWMDDRQRAIAERLDASIHFTPGKEMKSGPFTFIPIVIDHSAFDAYAFRIEADNVKVFHTGDFRTHGFRGGKLPAVLDRYIGKVDYVVCEGTNVKRSTVNSKTEMELQRDAEQLFRENKNNVVYVSTLNIDRLFSLYHAAQRAGRVIICDAFQRHLMDTVTDRDNTFGKSRLYQYGEYGPLYFDRGESIINSKFQWLFETKGYVLMARVGQKFENYLKLLPGESPKVYLSMWKGYINPDSPAYNPALHQAVGLDYTYLHTSGHCDMDALNDVFSRLSPRAIIPIHTDSPEAFADLFSSQWPVILLGDGEAFSPESPDRFHCTELASLRVKDDMTLESLAIGYFRNREDAENTFSHTVYNPSDLFGFLITVGMDGFPSQLISYFADHSVNAEYQCGDHEPGGKQYLSSHCFAPGDQALALIFGGEDRLLQCRVEEPVTLETEREAYQTDAECAALYDSFEDMVDLYEDWDWDSTYVTSLDDPSDRRLVNNVYLFPFREL